ncbi:helix-turn-helix domain-containing protein [Gluconacetobacter sacchari]|uniref:Helix-turn-helix domain-containing protein n=2 Tax=Gluconacetobacter sacchari TaxID=92759 RepID=A0A7W4NME7_9PROT|nr:helix-turn-helix domain-containing protein [Gluconacetobacter sacchari]MBB2160467.1 helix-turn-helix domain-containing protein [Gluconacetobacter sacchari]
MLRNTDVPTYLTYGRTAKTDDIGSVHIEKVMDRRSLHNGHVAAHQHTQLVQLCQWTSGGGTYAIDDRIIPFTAPTFVFMPTQVVHGFDVLDGSDAIVISLKDAEMTTSSFFRSPPYRDTLILNGSESPRPSPLITTLMEAGYDRYRQNPATAEGVVCGLANAILAEAATLARMQDSKATRPADHRIADLIEMHFRDSWSVSEYARQLGCTPYQLNAMARTTCGHSLKRLISDRRLLESKRLLAFTIRPIETIAAEIGLPDPAYFSRFFHRLTGLSPRDWRRQWLEKTAHPSTDAPPNTFL